jgi:hypothetical protein
MRHQVRGILADKRKQVKIFARKRLDEKNTPLLKEPFHLSELEWWIDDLLKGNRTD